MATNAIPEMLNDMRVYLDGADEFIGATSIDLPELSSMTTTVSGIGIAGEIDAPVRGHFGSMEATVHWSVTNKVGNSYVGGAPISLDAYGDNQHFDAGSSAYADKQVHVTIRGRVKSYAAGTWQAGNTADSSTTIEVHYYKLEIDGETVCEVDKYGYKCILNGTDLMADIRTNLGMA